MLVWCLGDMYVKRFLWGVEGVRVTGNGVLEALLGGVCDRVGSLMVVECDEGNPASGETFGGVGCGIVLSNISDRSNVENVRFASSAAAWLVTSLDIEGRLLTLLEVKLAMGSTLLLLRGSCR
jgi:hypothetical protein